MSELYVPYMDPSIGWANRVFIDAGEFYATGNVLKPLRPEIDCPSNAVYLDGLSSEEHGFPVIHSQIACLFESYSGDPAWRHFEDHQLSGSGTRVLVLRTAAVIGNYDYVLDWRFERDGNLRVAVGATGIIETKSVKAKNAEGSGHAMAGRAGRIRPLRRRKHRRRQPRPLFLVSSRRRRRWREQQLHGHAPGEAPVE